MAWFHQTAIVLWFVVFIHAGSFVVRDTRSVTDAARASWSAWGPWSQCNVLNSGRETRFRNCIDSQGKSQRSSNCPGHARRTRQCDNCENPLLNRHHATKSGSTPYTIIHSAGLSPTDSNAAWCSKQPLSHTANEYLEIKFENFVRLTTIATRGYNGKDGNGHVREYKVQFSYNGEKWFPYASQGREVVFNGNTDETQLRKIELDTDLVTRYIRVYPTKYESKFCLHVQLYGCQFNCGGLINDDVFRINAPNSAARIEEPSCLWRVESPEATKILLTFPYFKLRCTEGYLQIVDGASPFVDGEIFEELCGESRKVSPLAFMGREVWLYYRAYATTDIGFRLQGNILTMKTLNSTTGEIQIPEKGDRLERVFRYTWTITAPDNVSSILLTIHNFKSDNIRRVNGKCVGDSLIIHNGTGFKNSLVNRLCDEKFPQTLHSKTPYLRIKYRAGSAEPQWKLHFSYKILESHVIATPSTELRQGHDDIQAPTIQPGNSSNLNDTRLDVDAAQKNNSEESASNVPVIISSILAVVIAVVFLVALIHFLRRRKAFLRKHRYDCNTRPVSHFGVEDSTPFINHNVLMWTDSNSRKSDKVEKPKKNSLPHVTVALRDESPQRLSIIPAEMLNVSPPSENIFEEKPPTSSLVVSDAFTEECLQLLNSNFSSTAQEDDTTPTKDDESQEHDRESVHSDSVGSQSEVEDAESNVDDGESDAKDIASDEEDEESNVEEAESEPEEDQFDQSDLESLRIPPPEEKPAVIIGPRDSPMTLPEIEKYLAWGKI